MEKEFLSTEQMTVVLDNAPVAVFVSAVDSKKLLYYNRLAEELFLEKADLGAACYTAIGFEESCSFCHAEEMSQSELCIREYQHPGNQRIYQLSGKIITWAGAPAHIEYILDVTEKRKEEEQHKKTEEELQMTFDSIPCGLCVYELKDGRIYPLFHNQAFYDITGYSEETREWGINEVDLEQLQEKIEHVIQNGGVLQHTYPLWNEKKQTYRWIHLEGAARTCPDGRRLLYGVYSDVGEQKRLEKELMSANEKMQDIINAIPGGVAIYKMSDEFETVYFSDGVPSLCGYGVEEYRKMNKAEVAGLTYWEDREMVNRELQKVIRENSVADLEFRKLHRDGHIVWVHLQARQLEEAGGTALLHCVFHNISALKEAQLEMDHLVNSIPGGIASYRVDGKRFIPTFYSDGVMALSGHNREEYEKMVGYNALDIVYALDQERVLSAVQEAFEKGEVLDISYRICHKNGNLVWIHLNGRRIGPQEGNPRFYAVFTGMSAETRLFQSIANETADGIYVIDKRNYELLYTNESKNLFSRGNNCLGQKCYMSLHGKNHPCEFCSIKEGRSQGEEHEMAVKETGRFYSTRYRETDWNGIPAYIKYIRDITEEVLNRREKERLEMYFKTVVDKLPGGVSVIRIEKDGCMVPEYVSNGFAALNGLTVEETMQRYEKDICAGIYPDDVPKIQEKLEQFLEKGEGYGELVGRLLIKDTTYIWVKSKISVKQMSDGSHRLYSVYTDISRDVEEKEKLRHQYENLILQHYRTLGSNDLIVGHCNITQNKMLEIMDYTNSDLLVRLGRCREEFFEEMAEFIADKKEREEFRKMYLREPMLAAFAREDMEQLLNCFIKLPGKAEGCYVQIKVNLAEMPDTGDITGIFTMTDITKQTIEDRILHRLSNISHDYVIDLDLKKDTYRVLSCNENAYCLPTFQGSHSKRVAYMVQHVIVFKDRETYGNALEADEIRRRLKEGSYTFAYSMTNESGDIRIKNMTVFAVDLRLERICLVCTDITDSVREQQGLLNMMAYTFELIGLVNINTKSLVMYTRQMVLENRSPRVLENYTDAVTRFAECYVWDEKETRSQFCLKTMQQRLKEEPGGYDFVFPYQGEEGLRYKQINVMWGDQNHSTICMVRADVTDMLAAEQQKKKKLEMALEAAEEANRAKSDFLSAMSHDIRTPMNAIMGMTALAISHFGDSRRVLDCLQKISISSKHLLSLINDVLDMSKIECAQISLNCMKSSVLELVEQLSAIMMPQAKAAGLRFEIRTAGILHNWFYGDSLRINQILINILSNAVKFTPEGGRITFLTEEIPAVQDPAKVRYRFTVSDTGIGMTEEFLEHIFDPFARDSKASRIEGTGLGLSITKGLVELMEGGISVESQLNQGSVFRVELECEIAQEEKERQKEGGISLQKQKKIFQGCCFLVAEDNEINAEILCELLAMCGGTSVVKQDGQQTLQAFQEAEPGTYDAVLMDIQMPEMNGYEATRAIRGLDRQDAWEIPIVAMTANAFAEDIQACLEAGMSAHVAKPIDLELLLETLGRVLGVA